jgi:hypothetical protein
MEAGWVDVRKYMPQQIRPKVAILEPAPGFFRMMDHNCNFRVEHVTLQPLSTCFQSVMGALSEPESLVLGAALRDRCLGEYSSSEGAGIGPHDWYRAT